MILFIKTDTRVWWWFMKSHHGAQSGVTMLVRGCSTWYMRKDWRNWFNSVWRREDLGETLLQPTAAWWKDRERTEPDCSKGCTAIWSKAKDIVGTWKILIRLKELFAFFSHKYCKILELVPREIVVHLSLEDIINPLNSPEQPDQIRPEQGLN